MPSNAAALWLFALLSCIQVPPVVFSDHDLMLFVSRAGQLEVLRFLQGRNCPINLAVCAVAASAAGHVHVLQWLAQQHPGCLAGPGMDCLPTIVAAATGQLAVLQVRLLACGSA
jgi:hypothetical protein